MKLLKSLSLGLAVAAMAGTAHAAPTIIHVAGSTAFRTATSLAIIDTLAGTTPADGTPGDGQSNGTTTVYAAFDTSGKNIGNSNSMIYANGTIGSGGTATIIIEATWTGSLAGVVDLAAGSSVASFIDETDANTITTVNASPITPGTYSGASLIPSVKYHTTNNTVEMAMSDSNKTTISAELSTGNLSGTLAGTSYTGAAGLAALANNIKGSSIVEAGTLTSGRCAVVPFKWVLNKTSPAYTTVTNINQQQAAALFTAGAISQSLFTGGTTTADTGTFIFLTGRNEDSGTRIGALSESQFGVKANPVQWQIGNGSTVATSPSQINKFAANTPLNTEPQISWSSLGHSGYASGGNVSTALQYVSPNTAVSITGKPAANSGPSYFVGYLGLTDATSAISAGCTELTYNGVTYSANAVENGSYTFWTFEHCYRLSGSSLTATTIDAIADEIYAVQADAIFNGSTVTHAYNAATGNYTSGSAGLFDALNVNRGTTEGLPVTN